MKIQGFFEGKISVSIFALMLYIGLTEVDLFSVKLAKTKMKKMVIQKQFYDVGLSLEIEEFH